MPQFKKSSVYKSYQRGRATRLRQSSLMSRAATVYASRAAPISSIGQSFPRPRRGNKPEVKYLDTTIAISYDNVGAAGTCVPVNLTPQGNLVNQRTGNRITCLSISLSGEIQGAPNAGSAATQGCRTLFVWDTQPTPGIVVTAGTMFTTTDVSAQYNPSEVDRFKIIYDSRTAVGPLFTPAIAPLFNPNCSPIKPVSCYRSLKSVENVMNGAAATIATCTSNSLYLVTLGDQPFGGGGLTPTLLAQCRLRFIDP